MPCTKYQLSNEDKQKIIELYVDGIDIGQIAAYFKISKPYVTTIAKRSGVKLRIPRRWAGRK